MSGLGDFKLGEQLAYQGREGCTDVGCTRIGGSYDPETGAIDPGRCIGWHCPTCHEPVSSMGHECPERESGEGR